jgi:hypothetical protein
MTIIQRKLTEVAVEAFTVYLKEKVEAIKQLDLDNDGQKDVDQLSEIIARLGLNVKDMLTNTNFAQIAEGLEQIMAGAELIRSAVDKDRLLQLQKETAEGLSKIGTLSRLSIQYVKDQNRN